jgi:hypothetical protein
MTQLKLGRLRDEKVGRPWVKGAWTKGIIKDWVGVCNSRSHLGNTHLLKKR